MEDFTFFNLEAEFEDEAAYAAELHDFEARCNEVLQEEDERDEFEIYLSSEALDEDTEGDDDDSGQ